MTCESLLNISLSLFGWMNLLLLPSFFHRLASSWSGNHIRKVKLDNDQLYREDDMSLVVLRASCTILHVNGLQFMWADNVWLEIPIGKDEIFTALMDLMGIKLAVAMT